MRLFQEIEGADVIYINTYAATTPRLAAFKNICSSNSKEPELFESDQFGNRKNSSDSFGSGSSCNFNSESSLSLTDEENGSYFDLRAELKSYFKK